MYARSATFPLGRLVGAVLGLLLPIEVKLRQARELFTLVSLFKLSTSSRNAACDAIVDLIDGGTGAGTLKHYTGSQPTNVSDASSGTLLGTNTFSSTAFGSASTGVATAASITSDTNAAASGTAGYFRIRQGAGGDTAALSQGNSSTSAADLNFDNNVIVAGGTIAISSMTVTMPVS